MGRKGEIVGAVDFGSQEVRVLVARKANDGEVQVVGHGAAPSRGCIVQGVIQDLGAARIALKKALAGAEKEAGLRLPSVFCGINGRSVDTHIREGTVKLEHGIVELDHMEEALDLASRDVLAPGKRVVSSITSQEWYVDELRVSDPVGIRGSILKTRVHFALLPNVIEDNLVSCVESQGKELEDVVYTPLAAGLGCLMPEDLDLGVAVLDMGRTITGLAVYRDRRIVATHSFEWGGFHLTRDVAAGLQVSFEEANDLVKDYGVSEEMVQAAQDKVGGPPVPADDESRGTSLKLQTAVRGAPAIVDRGDLDLIIYGRSEELMIKVRQHLHARGLMKNLVRGMVLTGGAAAIRNQALLASTIFQTNARVGMPDGVEVLPQPVNSPQWVAATGIARHGLEFRAAAKSGRIETRRGPLGSLVKGISGFIGRYFI